MFSSSSSTSTYSSFLQSPRPLSPSVRTTVFVGSHLDWARGGRGEKEVHSILLVPWERLRGVYITLYILNTLVLGSVHRSEGEGFTLKTADPGGAMLVWYIWGVIKGVCDCPAVPYVNQSKHLRNQIEPLPLISALFV